MAPGESYLALSLLFTATFVISGFLVDNDHINNLINWSTKGSENSIPYKPARVLMHDFTGVPAVVRYKD